VTPTNQYRCSSIRRRVLELANKSGEGHIPSSLSIVEMLFACLSYIKKADKHPSHLVLSKGHASLAYYAALEEFGFISESELNDFCDFNSKFGGHPDATKHGAIPFSTGSLGHGLAMATGAAYFERHKRMNPGPIFVILGDQECNEGSVWEAALLGSALKLNNLVCLIDMNGSDSRSIPMQSLAAKWGAFNWHVLEVDGHSREQLTEAVNQAEKNVDLPTAIICKTIKGKGISFMENSFEWHHKKLDHNYLLLALEELESPNHA